MSGSIDRLDFFGPLHCHFQFDYLLQQLGHPFVIASHLLGASTTLARADSNSRPGYPLLSPVMH